MNRYSHPGSLLKAAGLLTTQRVSDQRFEQAATAAALRSLAGRRIEPIKERRWLDGVVYASGGARLERMSRSPWQYSCSNKRTFLLAGACRISRTVGPGWLKELKLRCNRQEKQSDSLFDDEV